MIDIYVIGYVRNGTFLNERKLVESIPASDQQKIQWDSPKVESRMGNAESMSFSIQPGKELYDQLVQLRSFIEVQYDGEVIFFGRVLTIENGFYGDQKIQCEGPLSFFNDSCYPAQNEEDRPDITIFEYLTEIINNHNAQVNDSNRSFVLGEVPGNYQNASSEQQIRNDTRNFGNSSWKDTKSTLEDLRSHYGGTLRVRREGGKLYLDWLQHYYRKTVNETQPIEVGKNIISMSSITEVSNIFTAVIPVGKSVNGMDPVYISGYRTDIHGSNNYLRVDQICPAFYTQDELRSGYHDASDYLEAVARYGMIFKVVEIQEGDTQQKLLEKCAEWIKDNYQGGIDSFTVSAVDLRQIGQNVDKIIVGDRTLLRYPRMENGSRKTVEKNLTCTAATYYLHEPENNQYTFGIPANSLSKIYGVKNRKTKSSSSTPVSSFKWDNNDALDNLTWFGRVKSWLRDHKVWYKHNNNQQGGPNSDQRFNYFLRPSAELDSDGVAKQVLWSPDFYIDHRNSAVRWHLDANGHPTGTFRTITKAELTESLLVKWKLLDYIKYEYGRDLTNDDEVGTMPTTLIDKAGNLLLSAFQTGTLPELTDVITAVSFDSTLGSLVQYATDGLTKISELKDGAIQYLSENGERVITKIKDGVIAFFNNDGQTVVSKFEDGIYRYFYQDPDTGEIKETNVRDLKLDEVKTTRAFGSLVTEYFTDPETGERGVHAYKFLQAIENYAEGELVVGHVDGDLLYFGSDKTSYSSNVSLKHMDSVCGDFEYERDPDTGIKYIKVNAGGGMRVRHGKINPVTGEFERDSHGNVIQADFGVYDRNTLTGGMIVQHLDDGSVTTKIKGKYVDIEATQVRIGNTSNVQTWMNSSDIWKNSTDETLDTYAGLIADRATIAQLNAQKARIDNLNASQIKVGTTSTVEAWMNSTDSWKDDTDDTLEEYQGLIADRATIAQLNAQKARIDNLNASQIKVGTTSTVEAWMNSTDSWKDDTDDTLEEYQGLIAAKATIGSLNALKARVDNLTADTIVANTVVRTDYLYFGTGVATRSFQSPSIDAKQFRIYYSNSDHGGSTSYYNLSNAIRDIQVVSAGNNQYKLQAKNYTANGTWYDVPNSTFSRATSLSGSWSGTKLTVKATPQGDTYDIDYSDATQTPHIVLDTLENGDLSVYNTSIGGTYVRVPLKLGDKSWDSGDGGHWEFNQRKTKDLDFSPTPILDTSYDSSSITSNGTYSPASDKIGFSKVKVNIVPTITGSWTNGKLTVSSTPSASENYVRLMEQGAASWNGTIVSLPIKMNWGSQGQYHEDTGWSASVNVSGKLQSKTGNDKITANGTYNPDNNYIGFSSIEVDVPSSSGSVTLEWDPYPVGDGKQNTIRAKQNGVEVASATIFLNVSDMQNNESISIVQAGGVGGTTLCLDNVYGKHSQSVTSNVASIGTDRGSRTYAGAISKSGISPNSYLGFSITCGNKTVEYYISINT